MSIDVIEDDQGQDYRSRMSAAHELARRPGATFRLRKLSMKGTEFEDCTDTIRGFLKYVSVPSNSYSQEEQG